MQALWAKGKITLLHHASSWCCYGRDSSLGCNVNLSPMLHQIHGMGCGHHDGFSCDYWCWQAYYGGDMEIRWPKNLQKRVGFLGDFSIKPFYLFINLCSNEQVWLGNLVRKNIFARRWCAVALSKFSSILTWLLHNPFNPSSRLKRFKRFIWLE